MVHAVTEALATARHRIDKVTVAHDKHINCGSHHLTEPDHKRIDAHIIAWRQVCM